MARRWRPASESCQPVCYPGNQPTPRSGGAGAVRLEDKDDHAPIFSLSKSSMDVDTATGPPHKRDPSWAGVDLPRRSHSTSTSAGAGAHAEPDPATHRRPRSHALQQISAANSYRLSLDAQSVDARGPPGLDECWASDRQRWSQCSSGSGTQSRSSTPDTVIWKDRTSRPSSLIVETANSPLADSKPTSPPTDTSPFTSPLRTPTSPLDDLPTSSPRQRRDSSSPTPSPLPPSRAHASPPASSVSPDLPRLASAGAAAFLESRLLFFTFPSPSQSSVSLAEGGAEKGDPDDAAEGPPGPSEAPLSGDGGARSPVQMLSYLTLDSPTATQGPGASVCPPELPRQIGPTGRRWRSPLVTSMSESHLGDFCGCHCDAREDFAKSPAFKEEGTVTSQLELADAAAQTTSPLGSLWGLARNASASHMGSHSVLGSPPGSRLNLKSSVGSHSNLVSPSSSMFPVSSGDEEEEEEEVEEEGEEERQGDDRTRDASPRLASSRGRERRRSCLKMQREESDDLARRGSMKQVQWDENGMTWDVYGASPDPEALSTAIRKHLEVQDSPRPARRTSKKRRAPEPPLMTNVAKELDASVMIAMPTGVVEGEREGEPSGVRGVGGEDGEEEYASGKSRADGEKPKAEEAEPGGEGAGNPNSPSRGSRTLRKRSVIRSLRRPGWCGGSRRADD